MRDSAEPARQASDATSAAPWSGTIRALVRIALFCAAGVAGYLLLALLAPAAQAAPSPLSDVADTVDGPAPPVSVSGIVRQASDALAPKAKPSRASGVHKGPDGLVGREAHAELPESKVLVLVDPRRPGFARQIASVPPTIGFLAHTAPPERMVEAVRQLARDEAVVDADLLVAALTDKAPLSAKELLVLEVAALGFPVKEIASRLSLSPGTVRNHLSRIIAKTGARNRIEAIHKAQESGWI